MTLGIGVHRQPRLDNAHLFENPAAVARDLGWNGEAQQVASRDRVPQSSLAGMKRLVAAARRSW